MPSRLVPTPWRWTGCSPKQGGLACQQADAVAAHVAAAAGARVDAAPYSPMLRGRLRTGHSDRFLSRTEKTNGSEVASEPLWWPPMDVCGRYLAPYLEAQGLVDAPERAGTRGATVDVRLSRSAGWSAVQSVSSTPSLSEADKEPEWHAAGSYRS